MVNGHRRAAFPLGWGVLQGDPLSPILYTLFLELLLDRIKRRVKELTVLGMNWKVGAFADNMIVGLDTIVDIAELKKAVGWYEQCSGQKLSAKQWSWGMVWLEGTLLEQLSPLGRPCSTWGSSSQCMGRSCRRPDGRLR